MNPGAPRTVDDRRACDPRGNGGVVVTILLAIYLPIIQSISGGARVTGRHSRRAGPSMLLRDPT